MGVSKRQLSMPGIPYQVYFGQGAVGNRHPSNRMMWMGVSLGSVFELLYIVEEAKTSSLRIPAVFLALCIGYV